MSTIVHKPEKDAPTFYVIENFKIMSLKNPIFNKDRQTLKSVETIVWTKLLEYVIIAWRQIFNDCWKTKVAKDLELEKFDKVWGVHCILCERDEEKIKWVYPYPPFEGVHTTNGSM